MIDNDQERIAAKAHELWEAEGRPHGRDQEHWDAAKEIVALRDSMGDTLLPASIGAEEPVEEKTIAIDNEGQAPGLTDTGEHDLTSIDREPAITAPPKAAAPKADVPKKAAAKRAATPKDLSKSEEIAAKPKAKSRAKGK